MATYTEAKAMRDKIEAEVRSTGAALDAFPKGAMGLTPDAVRAAAEWQSAKKAFDASFAKLRNFNAIFVKGFAKEARAERLARRA